MIALIGTVTTQRLNVRDASIDIVCIDGKMIWKNAKKIVYGQLNTRFLYATIAYGRLVMEELCSLPILTFPDLSF